MSPMADRQLIRQRVCAAVARVVRLPVLGERFGFVIGLLVGQLPGRRASALLQRAATLLAVVGNVPLSNGVVRGAARSRRREVLAAGHRLADAQGQDVVTDAIEQRLRNEGADELRVLCRAERLTRSGAPIAAIDLLRTVDRPGEQWSVRMTEALYAAGRFEALADHLREHGGLLPASTRVRREFEAYHALGRDDLAWNLVDISSPEVVRQPAPLGALLDAAPGIRTGVVEVSRRLSRSTSGRDRDAAVAALFQLGMVDDVLDHDPRRLGPTGRQTIAAAQYVRREFSRSRRLLATTRGTARHWDSEKLEARMRLEEGDFRGALDIRNGRSRLPPTFDEVRHYALLHLGATDEAFSGYVLPDDRAALRVEFSDRREERIDRPCTHRFVIAQDGPGDELLGACGYGSLTTLSDRLTITCDPRLTTLLQRSFPDIEFIPVLRLRRRAPAGFAGDRATRRADGALFRLLTEPAAAAASRCDRVALGRSLFGWALGSTPHPPYLVPDPDLVERLAPRVAGRVGLVWRSELMDPMRQIHYLKAADLAPLAALPTAFVCLQHDASAEERIILNQLFCDRIDWLDDVDLRDDFESTAAVVSTCALVVGIGTTVTELATAIGAPTIALHPTTWGTWRGRGTTRDVWHSTMRVAAADGYESPETCVANALTLVDEVLAASDSRLSREPSSATETGPGRNSA